MTKQTNGEDSLMINFVYDDKAYRMSAVETARFFGVKYGIVYCSLVRDKLSDQEVADYAAEKGQHYQRKKEVVRNFLYGGRLVP